MQNFDVIESNYYLDFKCSLKPVVEQNFKNVNFPLH